MEDVIIGTKIALLISMDPIGDMHMKDVDFKCIFLDGRKSIIIPKELMIQESADSYTALIDTSDYSPCSLQLRMHVMIPDSRFEGYVRDEYKDVPLNIKLRR